MSRHALLVGIDDYKDSPLACSVNDARGMAEMLMSGEYRFTCTVLLDRDVTNTRLKSEIERLLENGTEIALFYFAGHGQVTDYGAYLITQDVTDRADDGFDVAFLDRIISAKSNPDGAVVVILDMCQAGAMRLAAGNTSIAMRAEDLSKEIQWCSDRRAFLGACKDSQFAEESTPRPHGVFTFHLLEALAGGACDERGIVTVNAAYDFVAAAFETHSAQVPVYRGDMSGRIILGEGFSPRAERRNRDEIASVERQAREHLRGLQGYLAPVMANREQWQNSGHRTACKAVTPIIEWFRNRERDQPVAAQSPAFQAVKQELQVKIESLSHVEPGLHLESGVAETRIGFGTFGSVWKVRCQSGQVLALKVFHSQDLSIPEKVKRFRQGFSAMRRLDHPHVVKVNALYECPLAFSMDFISGPNLREWAGAAATPRELIELAIGIGDTLRHAHSREVVHRDVKPENIILSYSETDATWEPHLTDFDLAWFSTATLQTRDAIGTVFYAAPEQLGKPGSASAHSPRVDVFSFGQVLFYLCTGSDPTPLGMADNVRALTSRISDWPSGKAVDLVVNLYKACTEKSPDDRVSSLEEVCLRLYQVRATLRQSDVRQVLAPDEFVRELRFALVGFTDGAAGDAIVSPAGITSMSMTVERNSLVFTFQLRKSQLVGNVHDYKQARNILNERVRAAIRGHRACRMSPGGVNPYEVFVSVQELAFVASEIAKVQDVLLKVLAVLESS